MRSHIISCDLGSSTIKAALVDASGKVAQLCHASAPPVDLPEGLFDPDACIDALARMIRELVDTHICDSSGIAGICMTSQRSTIIPIGPDNRPLMPAVSWQGTACQAAAADFFREYGEDKYRFVTGLPPSPIYAAAKLAHIRKVDPDLFRKARIFALLPDYVLKIMGADEYVTDPSGGSASGLFDVRRRTWSSALVESLGIGMDRLPLVQPAGTRIGGLSSAFAGQTGLIAGTPLFLGGGDQQCAALGAGAINPGDFVLSVGTSAAIEIPLDNPSVLESSGLLNLCHVNEDQWVAEGFVNAFGSSFDWAKRLLGLNHISELEALARSAGEKDSAIMFFPFLAGSGSPDFMGSSRGAFIGLDLNTDRASLARSIYEGLAMEVRRSLDIVREHMPLHRILVTGGAGARLICETIARTAGLELAFGNSTETAIIGAAALGWFGAGKFSVIKEAADRMAPAYSEITPPPADCRHIDGKFRLYGRRVKEIQSFLDEHDG
jgi:xylulokinase